MRELLIAALVLGSLAANAAPDESVHNHPVPEKLGTVHFETSCAAAVQSQFDRATALLHSFAYDAAAKEFTAIAARDSGCAMAHWGVAMSAFHQLWSPPGAAELQLGREQLLAARQMGARSGRERDLSKPRLCTSAIQIRRITRPGRRSMSVPCSPSRSTSRAMMKPRSSMRWLLSGPRRRQIGHTPTRSAPPTYSSPSIGGSPTILVWRTISFTHTTVLSSHARTSRGNGVCEDRTRSSACAAHAIPHLHASRPLGRFDQSNEAARRAAREQGDVGEELHAMDYLTYAYLQRGRTADAERVVEQLRAMGPLLAGDFKIGCAATAMPVRLAIEQERWSDAQALEPLPGSAPHVAAIAHWARALAHARSGHADLANADVAQIDAYEAQARAHGDTYWAAQVGVLSKEARAWSANAAGHSDDAVALLRAAADAEDALEKLPVTPGPIIPAREQLGRLLLDLHQPDTALRELTVALKDAPGRRAGLEAAIRAAESAQDTTAAAAFRRRLRNEPKASDQ